MALASKTVVALATGLGDPGAAKDIANHIAGADSVGDISVSGTITAGAGFIATTGGLTATAGNIDATAGEIRSAGNRVNYNLAATAAGTAYALTNAAAALDFGTTDPVLTIDKAGTYLIIGRVLMKYNAATFAANQTVTIKLRRTNNTAADLTGATTTLTTRIITTLTDHFAEAVTPPVIYTTTNIDDAITLFGTVSTAPSAGSVDVTEANIIAVRLY